MIFLGKVEDEFGLLKNNFSFFDAYLDQKNIMGVIKILEIVSFKLHRIVLKCNKIVKHSVEEIETALKNSQIMNIYLFFSILKQSSFDTHSQVEKILSKTFFKRS